ncbi:MAG: CHAT domain-containing protein [Chloroflexota bacterium]
MSNYTAKNFVSSPSIPPQSSITHIRISLDLKKPSKQLLIQPYDDQGMDFDSYLTSDAKVLQRYKAMSTALGKFTRHFKKSWDKVVNPKSISKTYFDLLKAGNITFHRIFNTEAKEYLEEHISRLSETIENLVIQVETDRVTFPWELLVNEIPNLEETVSPETLINTFWGSKYIIHRTISKGRIHSGFKGKNLPIQKGLFVSDHGAPHVIDEIHALNEIMMNTPSEQTFFDDIPLFVEIHAKNDIEVAREIKKWLCMHFDLIHFAGHAGSDTEFPDNSYFTITKGFKIQLENLDVDGVFGFTHRSPFLIMNSCQTGNEAGRPFGFVQKFLSKNEVDRNLLSACGMIATQTEVPGKVAEEFSKRFYNLTIEESMNFGEALLRIRQDFLEKYNPLGLTYSLYAFPYVKFKLTSIEQGESNNE